MTPRLEAAIADAVKLLPMVVRPVANRLIRELVAAILEAGAK